MTGRQNVFSGLYTAQPNNFGGFKEARQRHQLSAAPGINIDQFYPEAPGTKIKHRHEYSRTSTVNRLLYGAHELIKVDAGPSLRDHPASYPGMCERGLRSSSRSGRAQMAA